MERGMNKIVIVTRKTRLAELIFKYNTFEQAKFYIEHMGVDFSDYVKEDQIYAQAVRQVTKIAERYARVQEIDRAFIPNMIFGTEDIVIAVGQDGLVANVMKYLDNQPLIGVNPDVKRWDGVLLPFESGQMESLLPRIIQGNYNAEDITMAEAVTKDQQRMLAVNDLFIGCKTHVSARYDITWNQRQENQSSSGIIISTGLGSTGWYKSIMTQTKKIAGIFQCDMIEEQPLSWGDNQLVFVVREPYPSRSTQTDIVYGKISERDTFRIISKMPADGVIFSDGMEEDAILFQSGMEVKIGISEKKGRLVV